jgi:hypothetical protein
MRATVPALLESGLTLNPEVAVQSRRLIDMRKMLIDAEWGRTKGSTSTLSFAAVLGQRKEV